MAVELALLALVALPFVVPASARETAAWFGLAAVWFLPAPALVWVLPFAIHQMRTVRVVDGLLTARTLRGQRSLHIRSISKVWVRGLASRGPELEFLGLTTDSGAHLLLSWSDTSRDPKREALRPVVRDIAVQAGVSVSPRARVLLDLPGCPSGGLRAALWLRSAILYMAWVVLILLWGVLYLTLALPG
jgi:hypothetical protein